jgi:ribonucleoside-triphosphate reductase
MGKVKIKKRDGSFQEFNLDKVKFAIQKAFKACQYDMNKLDLTDLYCDIEESIPGIVEDETIELEELQDLIEEVLMDFGYKDVAKNYILYRYQRKVAREQKFAEKLSGSNIENQNANVDEMSFGGRQGEASRIMTKDYALEHCVSKVAKENHLNNEVYIHDLDSLAVGMHNCCDRSTKFITDKGVFSFEDFNDGDKVTVLTHTGNFKPATVHCYGKQKLYNISFNRSGRIVQEKFTLNHRWILDTGEITTNLKVGDKLYKTPSIIANLDFLSSYKNSNDYWQVINIEESDEKDVWCLDVEEDHSFVLPNGIVTGNCLSLPIDKLLENGFVTRQTDVRPANSINTAFQLVAVLFQLQSLQQFGGVSCTHLDWTMVPYVRTSFWKHYNNLCKLVPFCKSKGYYNLDSKEIKSTPITSTKYCGKYWFSFVRKYIHSMAMYLTRKETRQAVEGMFHNLNTLQSRSGNQLPFTSVNFGTCTLSEGRMVIEELLNGSINGVGKYHRTPIFPCSIFQYMKGINDKPGTPNYDLYKLALKSTSERLYPNYVNVDWSGNSGYDINDPRTYMSTMGKCKCSSSKIF